MRRTTISDVAEKAGVSKGTVSKALSGRSAPPLVSASTTERIRRAAAELDYQPSLFARGLTTKRSQLVGVVIRSAVSAFWAPMLAGLQRVCAERGYHVVLGSSGSREDQAEYGRVLTRLGVDGVVVIGDFDDEDDLFEGMAGAPPLVGVCRTFPGHPVPCVLADNAGGVRAALDHLVGAGHRCIAYLTRRDPTHDARERLEACGRYLDARDLHRDDRYVQAVEIASPENRGPGVLEAVRGMLRGPDRPTAILAHDDMTALRAMSACAALGLDVPGDVAVVGFGDFDFAPHLDPPLTSVRMPTPAMGCRAAARLIARIEGANDTDECDVFPTELIVRGSSRLTNPVGR